MLSKEQLPKAFFTALAKPSGISLADHTQHVVDEARHILEVWPFLAEKYQRFFSDADLEKELLLAAQLHDLGKIHSKWQNACESDHQTYLKWVHAQGKRTEGYDRKLSAEYDKHKARTNYKGAIFRAGLRHELASAFWMTKHPTTFPDAVLAAVAAHHGKLSEKHRHRWERDGLAADAPADQKGKFKDTFGDLQRRAQFNNALKFPFVTLEEVVLERFRFDALRSLLQLADTRASRREGMGDEGMVALEAWKKPQGYPDLRPVQQAAKKAAHKWRTILRAPTGGGKTYAALLWAHAQIDRPQARADRLVIAMPTRFTSNALSTSADALVGTTGLYHSSAWQYRYAEKETKATALQRSLFAEEHKLSKQLARPVSICTIDHLLLCLTGSQEHHHSTFYFLANSCVVFDEVDFYDPFVQANLRKLLDVLKILRVPVLVMSATVPNVAIEQYGFSDQIVEAPRGEEQRAQKTIRYGGSVEKPEDALPTLEKMIKKEEGIIYANTVKRALIYYQYLKKHPLVKRKDLPIELYHSYYLEPDKVARERAVEAALGKSAWENLQARGIVILTQIGEMSINISTTLMLTDACPWDRLAQRVGRLARFSQQKHGEVIIVEATEKGKSYPPPYAEYQKGKEPNWIPHPAYTKSLEACQALPENGIVFNADYLVERVNEIYPEPVATSPKIDANLTNYHKAIKDNWLVLPGNQDREGEGMDGEKNEWQSRDIGPQQNVFIDFQPRFSNWGAYYTCQLHHAISVPAYRLHNNRVKEQVVLSCKVFIGEEDEDSTTQSGEANEPVFVAHPGQYSKELGFFGLFGLVEQAEKRIC